MEDEREAQKASSATTRDLQERVQLLTTALNRVHQEAEHREFQFRRINEATSAAIATAANAESLISTAEQRSLHDFL